MLFQKILLILNIFLALITVFNRTYMMKSFEVGLRVGNYFLICAFSTNLGVAIARVYGEFHYFNSLFLAICVSLSYAFFAIGSTILTIELSKSTSK